METHLEVCIDHLGQFADPRLVVAFAIVPGKFQHFRGNLVGPLRAPFPGDQGLQSAFLILAFEADTGGHRYPELCREFLERCGRDMGADHLVADLQQTAGIEEGVVGEQGAVIRSGWGLRVRDLRRCWCFVFDMRRKVVSMI